MIEGMIASMDEQRRPSDPEVVVEATVDELRTLGEQIQLRLRNLAGGGHPDPQGGEKR